MKRGRPAAERTLKCPEFDLGLTLNSGQTFHWTQEGEGYTGCIGSTPLFLRQQGNVLLFRGSSPEEIARYFAFDHDLDAIRNSCRNHPPSHEAAHACRGLRIMRQPRWECLATFILSPMKQVTHIRQMSLALRNAYGERLLGTPVPAFPTPEAIASVSEKDLRACALGFRAKGLRATAARIASGDFDPEAIRSLGTNEARKALCTLPGIGRKVANCILLFAYERLDAVPVDVWIGRILRTFRGRKASPEQLENYGARLLGPYAGYIQQYLFHQARTGRLHLPGTRKRPMAKPRRNPATSNPAALKPATLNPAAL